MTVINLFHSISSISQLKITIFLKQIWWEGWWSLLVCRSLGVWLQSCWFSKLLLSLPCSGVLFWWTGRGPSYTDLQLEGGSSETQLSDSCTAQHVVVLEGQVWSLRPYPGTLHFVPLKSIRLSGTLNGSFTYLWFWSFRKYWFLQSSKCWHILLYNKKKFGAGHVAQW